LRHRRLSALLVALTLGAGAASCTSAPAGNSSTTLPSTPEYDAAGAVIVAVPNLPTNFNPSAPQGANRMTAEVMEQVWPQTFVTDGQLAATTEPGFLEGAEVEGVAPFKVVYTLNPKAVWSDGTHIGLADFIYNWHEQLQWAHDLPDSGLAAGYEAISSITGNNGGSTIAVTFSRPFTEWESLFSDLVPAHIAERYGWVSAFEGFNPARVISGGPFEISSYTPGVQLVLSRNPHYWFTPARVAHIILEVEPANKALSNVEVGLAEIAQVPASPAVDAAVANAARSGLALTKSTVELPTLWQLCFNMTDGELGSQAFRTGIERSLSLDEIVSDSVGLSDASIAPYGSRLALGLGSQSGPGSNGLGNASPGGGSSGGSSGTGAIGNYDFASAVASFRSAGFVLGSAGVLRRASTGQPVTLSMLVPTGDPLVQRAADVIQAELDAVGIDLELHETTLASMLGKALPSGRYQMALAPFLLTAFPEVEVPVYAGSVLPSPASPTVPPAGVSGADGYEAGAVGAGVVTRDVFGLNDPTVASELQQAATNLNPTDDQHLIAAADARLWIDLPTLPLFQEPVDVVHQTDVRSVSVSPTWAGIFWNAQDWALQSSPLIVPTSVPPVG
jgi:ABC-type transport system substrate-binding protein